MKAKMPKPPKKEDLPRPPKSFDRVANKLEKRTVTPRSSNLAKKTKKQASRGPGY